MHIYVTQHEGPHPAAPHRYSTYITPTPVDQFAVAQAAFDNAAVGDIIETRHHELDYPTVPTDSAQGVEFIRQRYAHCARCHLSASRTRVCGVKGDAQSPIVVVGVGPSTSDDVHGEVFCGARGKLLDELLCEVGINPRALAYIGLVGCRPNDGRGTPDRNPTLTEKVACSERALGLLQALRPRVVLCLGDAATTLFWNQPPKPNTWHTLRPSSNPDDWVVVGVGRHPDYLLRSVMTRYQEYFSAKLFLLRMKKRMPTLTKTGGWRFGLRYMQGVNGPLWESHDPRR